MIFNDFFAGEIAMELLKQLISVSRKSCMCKSSADNLISSIQELLPIIAEIKYSGVELPAIRQSQLDRFSETLRGGLELSRKVLASSRWNVYKNLQLAKKMEKLEKQVDRFVNGPLQAHLLVDVHLMRLETVKRFDRLENRLEQRLSSMKIGARGWVQDAVNRMEVVEEEASVRVGLDLARNKVKKMVIGRDDSNVVGIWGIGGSGKTTLANEIIKDNQIKSYFNNRILFLTVSQSPDLEQLRAKIWGFITGNETMGYCNNNSFVPQGKLLQTEWGTGPRTLVVLDDVWSLSVLEQLIFKIPSYKTLVVSRFKFPSSVVNEVYKVELLRDHESVSLFCHSAFGQNSIPPAANETLVKQDFHWHLK